MMDKYCSHCIVFFPFLALQLGTSKMQTGGRVNCGPSLRTRSAFYPRVGIDKTLYCEHLMPRNDGGTLTGEDVVCIPCILCINDTNHDTMMHEQCEVVFTCATLC